MVETCFYGSFQNKNIFLVHQKQVLLFEFYLNSSLIWFGI